MHLKSRHLVIFISMFLIAGCSATGKNRFDVTEISDKEKTFEFEKQRARAEGIDPDNKLVNLSPQEHLDRGETALGNNDLTVAKLHFTLALSKDASLENAYLGLGETLIREGKYAEAKVILTQALAREEKNVWALAQLGILCRCRGEYGEALQHLTRANDLDPASAWLMTELAITYEMSGKVQEAEGFLISAMGLVPESPLAISNLGFNYLLQERFQDAIPLLAKALRLAPDNKIAINNLALAYALNHDERKSLQLFEASLGKAGAYNNLGYLLMMQEQNQDAERALSRAQELNPVYYARAKENLDLLNAGNGGKRKLFE